MFTEYVITFQEFTECAKDKYNSHKKLIKYLEVLCTRRHLQMYEGLPSIRVGQRPGTCVSMCEHIFPLCAENELPLM